MLRARPDVAGGLELGQVQVEGESVRAGCGAGSLLIEELQPSGKPRMKAAEWARGARIEAGERFE